MLLAMTIYALGVAYLELHFMREQTRQSLKNLPMLHSTLAFVISLLLVFRTNTAYERWWEGRKLWGSLVNNTRNLAAKLDALLPLKDTESRNYFRTVIPAFASELRHHLHADSTRTELFADEHRTDDPTHRALAQVDTNKHVPNQLAAMVFARVQALHQQGLLSAEQMLLVNSEASSLIDICGACERIKNTPIPFSYSVFIKKVIFFYVMTLPLGYVFSLGYFAVPVSVFIFYLLASLELVAEEIEDPFGGDANDLPLGRMSDGIEKHVHELLRKGAE